MPVWLRFSTLQVHNKDVTGDISTTTHLDFFFSIKFILNVSKNDQTHKNLYFCLNECCSSVGRLMLKLWGKRDMSKTVEELR